MRLTVDIPDELKLDLITYFGSNEVALKIFIIEAIKEEIKRFKIEQSIRDVTFDLIEVGKIKEIK